MAEDTYFEKYIQQRFTDLTTLMNARFNVVDGDNNEINGRLKELNGTVKVHTKEIIDLKINDALHFKECPAMPCIDKLSKDFNELKVEAVTIWIKKHWKLSILISISLLYVAYQLFTFFSIEQIINWIK